MSRKRIVERLIVGMDGDAWERVEGIGDLKKGDWFRMFEPDNDEPVVGFDGHTAFYCLEDGETIDGVGEVVVGDRESPAVPEFPA